MAMPWGWPEMRERRLGLSGADGGGGSLYREPMSGQALSAAYRKNIPFGRGGFSVGVGVASPLVSGRCDVCIGLAAGCLRCSEAARLVA